MSVASRTERITTTPTTEEQARYAFENLSGEEGTLTVERSGHPAHTMPREVGLILQRVLFAMAQGHTVTIGSMPDELTTSAAADILGISRPTLMKMIHSGDIEAHMVGSHHRLKAEDVLAARRARRAAERAAFDELRDLDDSFE